MEHAFIRFNRNAMLGQLIENSLQDKGLMVEETMELESLEAISGMVAANLEVRIVPPTCVRSPNPAPVKRITLGKNAPVGQLILIHCSDNPRVRVIMILHATILEAISIGRLDVAESNVE